MEAKVLEVRDRATFIPMLAVLLSPANVEESERYLMRRSGYEKDRRYLVMTPLGGHLPIRTDANDWSNPRMRALHGHVLDKWSELKSGQVVDIEFALGETSEPKTSERCDTP